MSSSRSAHQNKIAQTEVKKGQQPWLQTYSAELPLDPAGRCSANSRLQRVRPLQSAQPTQASLLHPFRMIASRGTVCKREGGPALVSLIGARVSGEGERVTSRKQLACMRQPGHRGGRLHNEALAPERAQSVLEGEQGLQLCRWRERRRPCCCSCQIAQ